MGQRRALRTGGASDENRNATYSGGKVGERSATLVFAMGLNSAGLDPALALRPLFGHAPSRGTGATK